MKKIILILFLFSLLYACYYIYKTTEENNLDIVLIGDSVANNPYLNDIKNVGNINNDFVNNDYHINDIVNILTYNQELYISNKTVSIHQLLKQDDIVIISIGMNDIYYKLNDNLYEIYTYLNEIVYNYDKILNSVNHYNHQKVYILGYYNINNKYNDIFNYVNYKLRKLADKYGYIYLDLNKILYNNDNFYVKKDNFYLNNDGYGEIYKLIVEKL